MIKGHSAFSTWLSSCGTLKLKSFLATFKGRLYLKHALRYKCEKQNDITFRRKFKEEYLNSQRFNRSF